MLWNGFYVFLFVEHMLLGSSFCIQAGMRWKTTTNESETKNWSNWTAKKQYQLEDNQKTLETGKRQ